MQPTRYINQRVTIEIQAPLVAGIFIKVRQVTSEECSTGHNTIVQLDSLLIAGQGDYELISIIIDLDIYQRPPHL